MNILINIKIISKFIGFDTVEFFNSYFLKVITDHPEHNFFIIEGADLPNISLNNCTFLTPAPKSIFLKSAWYNYRLPAIIKKFNINIFVNLDSVCSNKTKLPQLLLVPDLSVLQTNSLSKKNILASLQKATSIITFSQTNKNELCKILKINEEKIKVIYTGPSAEFTKLDIGEKEAVNEKYAEGKAYFLYSGEINADSNLINLLKAFSFFKKRQKSNMQLLIITKSVLPNNAFVESLRTYKYRNEVKLLVGLPQNEVTKITASAYAVVFATHQTNNYVQLLEAMQCEVPAIVSNSLVMNELAGDAVLYTEPAVFENIADKMMLLFKDEIKKNDLVIKGKIQSASYSAATTSDLLWQHIVKCAGLTH